MQSFVYAATDSNYTCKILQIFDDIAQGDISIING